MDDLRSRFGGVGGQFAALDMPFAYAGSSKPLNSDLKGTPNNAKRGLSTWPGVTAASQPSGLSGLHVHLWERFFEIRT